MGIPFLGGLLIISLGWAPLLVMLVLHIAAVLITRQHHLPARGNILGIIASCLGWIPFVGMLLHIVTAVVILADAYQYEKQNRFHIQY